MMSTRIVNFRSLLILAFLFFATTASSTAQEDSKRTIPRQSVKDVARSRTPRPQNKTAQLFFDYYPAVLDLNFKDSEFVFVAIAGDGTTRAVRYGPYNPAIIGVYESRLPKISVTRFVARAEEIIPKASEITKPYIGSCDSESFRLSVDHQNKMAEHACLFAMPQEIRDFVEELRTVWKQLDEVPLAYGYLTSFPLHGDFLKSAKRNPRDYVSIRSFPPKLQAVVRKASRQTPKFYALSREQYDQLKAFTRYPSHPFDFDVVDNKSVYYLTLFQSRARAVPSVKRD